MHFIWNNLEIWEYDFIISVLLFGDFILCSIVSDLSVTI